MDAADPRGVARRHLLLDGRAGGDAAVERGGVGVAAGGPVDRTHNERATASASSATARRPAVPRARVRPQALRVRGVVLPDGGGGGRSGFELRPSSVQYSHSRKWPDDFDGRRPPGEGAFEPAARGRRPEGGRRRARRRRHRRDRRRRRAASSRTTRRWAPSAVPYSARWDLFQPPTAEGESRTPPGDSRARAAISLLLAGLVAANMARIFDAPRPPAGTTRSTVDELLHEAWKHFATLTSSARRRGRSPSEVRRRRRSCHDGGLDPRRRARAALADVARPPPHRQLFMRAAAAWVYGWPPAALIGRRVRHKVGPSPRS